MRLRPVAIPVALACVVWGSLPAAETGAPSLEKNPFTRPEVLKPKPPPPAPVAVVAPEAIELNLTATLVSATAPMAVVDGELLSIGDRVEGMQLIAVMEGKAVFARAGKRYTFEIKQWGQK